MPDYDYVATPISGDFMTVEEYDDLKRRFSMAMHDCGREFFLKYGDSLIGQGEIEAWVAESFAEIGELTSYQLDVLQAEVVVFIDRRRLTGQRGRFQDVH